MTDGITEGQGKSSIAPLFQSWAINITNLSCAELTWIAVKVKTLLPFVVLPLSLSNQSISSKSWYATFISDAAFKPENKC